MTKLSVKTPPGAVLWILHPVSSWLVKKLAALTHLTLILWISVTSKQRPRPGLLASPVAPQLKSVCLGYDTILLAVLPGRLLAGVYRPFVPECLTLKHVLDCWVVIVGSPVHHIQFFFLEWIPESAWICRVHSLVLNLTVSLVDIVKPRRLILVTDFEIERFV